MSVSAFYEDAYTPKYPGVCLNAMNPQYPKPTAYQPLEDASTAPLGGSPYRSKKQYQGLLRSLRIVKLITASTSSVINAIIFGLMVYVEYKYYDTRSSDQGGVNAWPEQTKVWPSIMLLVASITTLLISLITLTAYCRNFSKASGSWKITLLKHVVHIGVWVLVSILYKYEKGLHGVNNDIWGWSCVNKSSAVQAAFQGKINFGSLCSVQSRSWDLSIAEPVAKFLFAIGQFRLKRKVDGAKQKFSDNAGGAAANLLQNMS